MAVTNGIIKKLSAHAYYQLNETSELLAHAYYQLKETDETLRLKSTLFTTVSHQKTLSKIIHTIE